MKKQCNELQAGDVISFGAQTSGLVLALQLACSCSDCSVHTNQRIYVFAILREDGLIQEFSSEAWDRYDLIG